METKASLGAKSGKPKLKDLPHFLDVKHFGVILVGRSGPFLAKDLDRMCQANGSPDLAGRGGSVSAAKGTGGLNPTELSDEAMTATVGLTVDL